MSLCAPAPVCLCLSFSPCAQVYLGFLLIAVAGAILILVLNHFKADHTYALALIGWYTLFMLTCILLFAIPGLSLGLVGVFFPSSLSQASA